MRLLVTGRAGFIGSNFVRPGSQRHPEDHALALDLLTYAGDRRNLDGLDVRLVEGDIGHLELVERILVVRTSLLFGCSRYRMDLRFAVVSGCGPQECEPPPEPTWRRPALTLPAAAR